MVTVLAVPAVGVAKLAVPVPTTAKVSLLVNPLYAGVPVKLDVDCFLFLDYSSPYVEFLNPDHRL
jgi:hypothetical protein